MFSSDTGSRSGTVVALAAAVAVLAFQAWFMADNTRDLCDDAMISARYARNWAYGDGLAYNRARTRGQKPVEGYSNFLWVAVLAAGFKLGLEPRLTTAAAGMACGLAATLLVGVWVWRITRRRMAAVAAMAALGLSLPFGLWAVQGLETPLIALLFVAVAATIDDDRPRPWPWVLALLAALTRPDGLLAAAALALVELRRPAVARASCPCPKITGRMPVPLLWFVLPFLAYTLWRWQHFGALAPNTFGAKTGLGWAGVMAGLNYLRDGFHRQWMLTLLALAGVAGFIQHRKLPSVLFSAVLLSACLVFIAAVGGDFMPESRFVMHLLPLIVALGTAGIAPRPRADAVGRSERLVEWAGAAMILAVIFSAYQACLPGKAHRMDWNWHRDQASWYGPTASWLAANTKRTDVIAAGDIGYIGYVTDNDRILDFNGLVDRHLASLPGAAAFRTDPDYVFDQRPEWMVLMVHRFEDGQELGHTAFDRAAFAGARLKNDYTLQAELPGWRQSVPAAAGEPPTLSTNIIFRIYRRRAP